MFKVKKNKKKKKKSPTFHGRKATLEMLKLTVRKVMGLRDLSAPPLQVNLTRLQKSSSFCTLGQQQDPSVFQYQPPPLRILLNLNRKQGHDCISALLAAFN